MKLFRSPFEKLSLEYQQETASGATVTAMAVSPGGALFALFTDMNKHLKEIAKNTQKSSVKISGKAAKSIGKGVQGIGTGMKMIAEAINAIPDAKEAKDKMDVIVGGIDAMKSMGKAILTFAGMLALSLPLFIIGIAAVPLAMAAILLIGGTFYLLDKLNVERSMKKVSIALMIAGAAIVTLAASFTLFGIIAPPIEQIFQIGAVVLGTAAIFFLVGKFSMSIAEGAIAMTLAAIPLLLIAASFSIFASAVTPDKSGWNTIAQVGAAVTGLGLVMAAAGAAAVFIIPGAAAMVLAGAALITLALGLGAMAAIFKPGKFDYMLADSGHETEGFLGFGGGRMMSNMEWAILSVARSFTLPPASIASMYLAAPALILAGTSLLVISKSLEKFQALNIDYELLPMQIAKVTNVLADAFAAVGKKYPGGGGGFMSALFGSGSDTSVVAQGISAVGGMGRALGSIASGVQYMADLKFPTKWDKDGNAIEFRTLTDDDFAKVTRNTQMIVTALSGTFAEIGANPNAKKSWFLGSSNVDKGIKIVNKLTKPLGKLAEFVQTFGDNDVTLGDADTSLKNIAGSMGEWTDSINDLDIEKVTEVRKLYEGLAALSGNNGPNIVEQMGQSMIDAIELLSQKLGEFSEGVQGTVPTTNNNTTTQATTAVAASKADNTELVFAIKNLERVMSGTQQVFVVNQEGGI